MNAPHQDQPDAATPDAADSGEPAEETQATATQRPGGGGAPGTGDPEAFA